ncbi:MAG: autotransporter domain-containing protein, partial [Hyphomicrobiales bacterium]|nr:autotransporter domain-containing protein [Hyphomicrobiales bacterium]
GVAGGAAGGGASGGAGGTGNQSNFTIAGLNITPGYNARTALPVLTHADEAAPKHNFALSDLLQLGAFRVSLFHDKNKDKSKKRRARPATSAPSKWAIWGRGNVRGFASETDAGLELDGNAYAGWLGVDYTHSRSLMGGLAVSYDESRTDYTDPEFGGGEVSTRLGSFYPYLRISPTEALDLWGLMGFGWADLSFSGEGQEDTSTDMSLQVYALGAQLKLIDLYGAQFSLKSDASFAILETASQANLPGIRTEPSRMRFALAAQYPWQIDSVSRVTPSVELGGRLDFNEVSGGAGMELGGAVNYNHSTLRLNAEARARGLVYHNDPNVQDWGVSFQLRVDPNQFGQGFFASFAPHWGQSQSRVQRLWRDLDAPQGLAQDMSLQPHQMEAEFGYGFALPRMKATLSPFGRTRFAQTGAQTFSLGSRLQLGDIKLELTGEQQTAPLAPTDHRMSLHLSMPLGR